MIITIMFMHKYFVIDVFYTTVGLFTAITIYQGLTHHRAPKSVPCGHVASSTFR